MADEPCNSPPQQPACPRRRPGIVCPRCGGLRSLMVKRRARPAGGVRRVRDCRACGHRYRTVELLE